MFIPSYYILLIVLGLISPFLYLASAVNDFHDELEQIKLTTGGNHLIWMGMSPYR